MFRKSFAAFALIAALAAPAVAQSTLNTDPAKVEPGVYAIETNHTRVLFSVLHMGFSTWYGEFSHVTGTLTLPARGVSFSDLEVTIPTGTISTSNTILDGELKSPDWYDVARFPTIHFKATKVERTGERTADVNGDLTFHGVTKPVVLKATFNSSGVNPMDQKYTVGFEVTGTLKRSDFGVTKYVPLVGDEVTLIISAAFERQ